MMNTFATNRFLVSFAYFSTNAESRGYRVIEKEFTNVELASLLTDKSVNVYAVRRLHDDRYSYDGKAVTDW